MRDVACGSYVKYVIDGCRCEECTRANREYVAARKLWTTPPYVGADRARQHLHYLAAHGVGFKTVAKRAGVAYSTIGKIIYGTPARGPSKRVRPETEAAILAVSIHDAADGAKVSAKDVPGIVATLTSRGWTKSEIGRRVHGPDARSLQLSGATITAGNLRRLRALLDEPAPAPTTSWAYKYLTEAAEVEEDDQAVDDGEPDRWERRAAVDLYETMRIPEGLDHTWKEQATCRRPEYPTSMFFPGRGDNETLKKAREACERCPVARQCREFGTAIGARGVWGGTSEKQRKRPHLTKSVA